MRRRQPAGTDVAKNPNHATRERILAASLKLVASRGYAGTSISMICREAGLNASSVYWFFESKEDLLMRAIQESADEFLDAASQPFDSGRNAPGAGLEATIAAIVGQLDSNSNFLRLVLIMMIEDQQLPGEVRAKIARVRASSLDWWKSLLAHLFGDLGETTARLLAGEFAPLCRATVNGAFIARQFGEPVDLEVIVQQLFLLLNGVRDRIGRESDQRAARRGQDGATADGGADGE
ncbi:MAG: TetR/AcrR family transcriptional regulator [Reyranella sp.]|nr:TetR/AcrR family transcriptional regulator [Reyranella sp.]